MIVMTLPLTKMMVMRMRLRATPHSFQPALDFHNYTQSQPQFLRSVHHVHLRAELPNLQVILNR